MEIYCHTDQSFICYLCTMEEHKGHETVPTKTERTEKQNELKEEQIKFQQRIQEKEKKVQELKQTVDIIKMRSQAAVDDSERIFSELISSMEKKRSEVMELIRTQEKAEVSRAERLLNQLEQEIADLKRRVTELEELSHTHDHIHFLQSFPSLCVSPGCEDSPSFTVNQHLSFDGVRKSLSDLKKQVEQICEEEFNKIRPQAAAVQMILPPEPKRSISVI
ncbi:tripartite motif-containing protein 29-like [Hemibagrus wyckioides]|uniref:tripartite motif-containing protein 29-like n=1 Tax=Hemibagrus wyckioides TaxID=337641 RepID=UPI00266B978F|nr:tripartite motif-containing protein 29-like [Hemibagrus wyckioides]